jgi:O-methyltransferase
MNWAALSLVAHLSRPLWPWARLHEMQRRVRILYIRFLRARIRDEINRQRLKLIWDIWGYRLWLGAPLPIRKRLGLLWRFIVIDWNVVHGHKPSEIVHVLRSIAARRAEAGEVVLEAGCWKGGSTCKFSLVCAQMGYRLEVFDSFEGVQAHEVGSGENDFSGNYAASEAEVQQNISRYGAEFVCTLHKGWFADTLQTVPGTVRVVYIDCDVSEGTQDVLRSVTRSMIADGAIFTQDFHIESVRCVLEPYHVRRLSRNLASIHHATQT